MTKILAKCADRFFNFSLQGAFLSVGALDQDQKAAGQKFFIKRANEAARPVNTT